MPGTIGKLAYRLLPWSLFAPAGAQRSVGAGLTEDHTARTFSTIMIEKMDEKGPDREGPGKSNGTGAPAGGGTNMKLACYRV